MKKILLFLFAITLFEGVLIAQKTSKAEVARQLIMGGKEKKAGIDINTTQVPEEDDVQQMKVTSENYSSKTRLTHLYFQQQVSQIPVHAAIMDVHVTDDNQLFSYNSRFVKETDSKSTGAKPALTAAQAVEQAARQLGYDLKEKLVVKQVKGGPTQQVIFEKGSLSQEDIPVSLVWQPVEEFLSPTHAVSLKLAWDINIYEPSGNNWWSVRVDAQTGIILDKGNWVVNCNFEHYGYDKANLHSADLPHVHSQKLKKSGLENFLFAGGGTYNVFPQPLESPYDGTRQLISDPADPIASPYGWHDANGVAGPEYTITLGNNVYAYTDLDANNSADPGSSPDGGAGLMFDFPLDLNNHPSTYRPAVVTNLFYWNNYMHDFSYKYGFDEANGNFQINNYGKGGLGNDFVRAEAQDGSGTNNANFATPPDGSRPRMQMYLWIYAPVTFTVSAPAGISGNYTAVEGNFSNNNKLGNLGPVSGQVVYYNDDADGTAHLACGAPANSLAGKIALIDRGTCAFAAKAKNAQNAGAIAVIVVNNVPGPPSTMGGTDNTVTIPAVMISQSDGDILAAELANNVTVSLSGLPPVVRDSDLDNGIIAHEYAHGISNRLTGGPANTFCLSNEEQMGEGWSDYFALMTTMKAGDVASTPRGIGNYANATPANGNGIRPQPYTTNQSINSSTYNTVKNPAISIPHGIGFVWATMLWDMTWALIDAHGRATGFDEAMNLVMEGMKLQPCSPGFVDGRDAILAADQALYGGANACIIWKAFARRGLGVSANQGSSEIVYDGFEAFDVPDGCPGFSVSSATGNINSCPGIPSASPNVQQFTVTGISVATDVEVNAPADFEVSTNVASGYGPSLTIPSVGGSVPKTIVYVRSAATAPDGDYTGEVMVSTTGYATIPVVVNGFAGGAKSAFLTFTNDRYAEGFAIVDPLPTGWSQQNLSTTVGTTNWFQGNPATFPAHSGPDDSYIAANFYNTTDANTISNWLFTPEVILKSGDIFSFWTRTAGGDYPDRLEVRMSTNGASTDVGATDASTGDFSTLLLMVNPDLTTTGYPTEWTKFMVTIPVDVNREVSGRIAFRYFVTNAGPDGSNSNYIGIDDVVYEKMENELCDDGSGNLKVYINGGGSPFDVGINVEPQGQPASLLSLTDYVSGTPIPMNLNGTTTFSIASITSSIGCSGVGSSNTLMVQKNPLPLPVIASSATVPTCPGEPVTLGYGGTMAGTPCTNDVYGKWPLEDHTFNYCANANFFETIAGGAWLGEYSVVNVEAGNFYWFASIDGGLNYLGDVITITDITGATVYSTGVNYAYFRSGFTGKIRFYTHGPGCTASDEIVERYRFGYCSSDPVLTENLFGIKFFSWSPGGATTASITVNPAVTSSYSLTFQNHNLLWGNFGCAGTSTKEVKLKSNEACGIPSNWYRDADGDGYGNPNPAFMKFQVARPRGYVLDNTDCRDFDPLSFPGADEQGDGIDNNCDGQVDEGLPCLKTWYYDGDGDGYGADNYTRLSCKQHNNFVLLGGDCKNWDASVYPGKGCAPITGADGMIVTNIQPKAMVEVSSEILVFPNPARDEITVILNGFETGKKLDLTLVLADGKPVTTQSTVHTGNGQQVQMDVRRLSSGYYLLKASQGQLQQIKKVMIIR